MQIPSTILESKTLRLPWLQPQGLKLQSQLSQPPANKKTRQEMFALSRHLFGKNTGAQRDKLFHARYSRSATSSTFDCQLASR